jgi:mRNA interferase HicA
MKRQKLLKHLATFNCTLLREGSSHSIYINQLTGNMAPVPRHSDIKEVMAGKICKELGVPKII